jgi:hypothetical protein
LAGALLPEANRESFFIIHTGIHPILDYFQVEKDDIFSPK